MNQYILKKYPRKQKALIFFTKSLLSNCQKDKIGPIVLFGSLAKGGASKNSDIDLAIFIRGKKTRQIEDIIDELSFDSTVRYGESIEPLIYSYQEYQEPKSSFLKEILQYGQTITAQ